jgi:hypothetical protein
VSSSLGNTLKKLCQNNSTPPDILNVWPGQQGLGFTISIDET